MKRFFWLFFPMLVLTACEKDIEFDLDEAGPKLVVEAVIENNQAPLVILTKSVGFFSSLSLPALMQSFVHDAVVTISNGSLTHQLKEYQLVVAPGISLYYYSIDSASLSTAFLGALNTSYSLEINTGGEVYTAFTTIPGLNKQIDSLWWKPAPPPAEPDEVVVMVRSTDAPGYGDYVRYYTSTNQGPFLPGERSVFDDLFVDGTTYDLQVDPGYDRNSGEGDKEFFNRGDTVVFKLSGIDKATYDFWRTWEYSIESIGNPFSTPVKVLGNIGNGALGYFGGYASQYHTVIIPQ